MAYNGKQSVPTGLYMPCPFNAARHPRPLVLPIRKGPKVLFSRCGECGCAVFCPVDWDESEGLTLDQAQRGGFTVLTITRKATRR